MNALLAEELDQGIPLARHRTGRRYMQHTVLNADELLELPLANNALGIPGKSPLCRHDEWSTWEYGGYSEKAEGYHVWRCKGGGCQGTMIRECTKRTRVDRECRCFQEVEE